MGHKVENNSYVTSNDGPQFLRGFEPVNWNEQTNLLKWVGLS